MPSKVIVDISMSADGFVKAADATSDEPLGQGGHVLHDWLLASDEQTRQVMEDGLGNLGATIAGRRTYDDSLRWWGADGPSGPARKPLIVLTHQAPDDSPEGGVYTFVTDGIESALAQAREAAGGGDVAIMGGPTVVQQFLAADLVDEVSLHVAPVLFGAGTPLRGDKADVHVNLEVLNVVATPTATHFRYQVKR